MPNYYLSVLYKHIIQVENKNVGLKVGGGGHKYTIAHPVKKVGGGTCPPLPPPPPPASYASDIYIYIYISGVARCQKVGGTQTRNLYTFGKEPI